MAKLYRQRGSQFWWAWGYDRNGKRWRRSTKQTDKRAAETVAASFGRDFALDADQPRDEACTIESALDLMIDHARRARRADATLEIMETKGRHLVRVLGAKTRCSSITLATTTGYVHTRTEEGAHVHTVAKEVKTLLQALRRAAKLGKFRPSVDLSALMPDELAGAYVPRDRWLDETAYRMLLAEFDPARTPHRRGDDRREYIVAWCQTGLRESELYAIEARHVDAERRELHVPGTKTEQAARLVPLTPAALDVFRRRAEARPTGTLFPRWGKVQRDLDLACLRIEARLNPGWKRPDGRAPRGGHEAGEHAPQRSAKGAPVPKRDRVHPPVRFETVSPNDLRRTFASWLAQAGVPLHHAAKLMGHASIKMLERVYARLAPKTLHDAVAMLPASVSGASASMAGAMSAERNETQPKPSRPSGRKPRNHAKEA